jgi:hypothetical protein
MCVDTEMLVVTSSILKLCPLNLSEVLIRVECAHLFVGAGMLAFVMHDSKGKKRREQERV